MSSRSSRNSRGRATRCTFTLTYWPGETLALGGLQQKVLAARMYPSGKPVKFEQEEFRVRFIGLPGAAPDPCHHSCRGVRRRTNPRYDMPFA